MPDKDGYPTTEERELNQKLDDVLGKVDMTLTCGCGYPEAAWSLVKQLLDLCPWYEHSGEINKILPDERVYWLILYYLDSLGLVEHGTRVSGSWITEKGEKVRDLLGQMLKLEPYEDSTKQRSET